MGSICSLCCQTTTSSEAGSTVKLILMSGELKEFYSPVKVSNLLHDNYSFICESDGMDFDELVTAMNGDEELKLGQLYFELPSAYWLTRRLQVADMASLAVKASVALTRSSLTDNDHMIRCCCCGGCSYRPKRVDPRGRINDRFLLELPNDELMVCLKNKKKKGGRLGKVKLSVIHEEEDEY